MEFGAHVSASGGHRHGDRPDRGDRRRLRAGVHAEPAHVAPDEPQARGDRAVPGAARRGGHRWRRLPRALSLQPGRARRRDLREVDRDDAHDGRRGHGDRGRRRRLPRRLAPRRGLRRRPRPHGAGARAHPRALQRRHLAADGELRGHRRDDRALDRRARDARSSGSSGIRDSASASTRATSTRRATTSPTGGGRRARRARSTRRIGLDRLRALHINDSATPLGSNRDRHANILEGEIGEGLGAFLAHPAFQHLSAYLEVPGVEQEGPERRGDPEAARPARALDDASQSDPHGCDNPPTGGV